MLVTSHPSPTPDLLGTLTPARAVADVAELLVGHGPEWTVDSLGEVLYAIELRRDALGAGLAADDARERLDGARAVLELELARVSA